MATTALSPAPAPAGGPSRRRRAIAGWVAAAAVAASPWAFGYVFDHRPVDVPPPAAEGDYGRTTAAMAPALSPDGSLVVFTLQARSYLTYLVHADGTGLRRLATGGDQLGGPSFTSDGRQVLYVGRDADGGSRVHRVGVDGRGAKALGRLGAEGTVGGLAFSPDGHRVAFTVHATPPCESEPEEASDCAFTSKVYVMDVDGGGRHRIADLSGNAGALVFSPDGTRVAFVNTTDETTALYLAGVDVEDGALRRLAPALRSPMEPAFTADGRAVTVFESRSDGTGHRRVESFHSVALDGTAGAVARPLRAGAATSADGSRFVWAEGPSDFSDVYIQGAGDPTPRRLTNLAYEPEFFDAYSGGEE